jgi:hypothetical protein
LGFCLHRIHTIQYKKVTRLLLFRYFLHTKIEYISWVLSFNIIFSPKLPHPNTHAFHFIVFFNKLKIYSIIMTIQNYGKCIAFALLKRILYKIISFCKRSARQNVQFFNRKYSFHFILQVYSLEKRIFLVLCGIDENSIIHVHYTVH